MITYQEVKDLVKSKLIDKTDSRSFEELSEYLFGEGNCFCESEVRKRMYGMQRLVEIIEASTNDINISRRILSISDAHIPFNLSPGIFKQYSGMVDILIFNGDILDCQSISKFPRLYRISLTEEMIRARKYMTDVIKMIQPKTVYINVGNLEKRLGKYLSERLNDDLMRIMPDNPLDLIINDGFKDKDRENKTETYYSPLKEVFKDSGIDIIYTGGWYCMVGNTIFAHPLSYSSGMLKTTEKATDYFLRKNRIFTSVVLGHTHKLGSFIQGGIQMYEQGCTCDLSRLDYADGMLTLPNQNGFIYICQDIDGNIINEKTKIVKI